MIITKESARGYLPEYVRSITSKSKGGNYVCPLCGSGTGPRATGAFSIKDGTTWKCFACDEGGDVFDLIGKHENIATYPERVKWFERWKGVTIESTGATPAQPAAKEAPTSYTDYYLQAKARINETTYHRGISAETLDRFSVGYDPAWRHPKKDKTPATPRLIVPTSAESYIARDTRPDAPKEYAKMKVGHTHIFNAKALERAGNPIFVVEGELDALSIIDAGGEAVALGSTTMVNRFVDMVKGKHPAQPLIIALDDDGAGKDAGDKLAAGLEALGIPFYRENPAPGYKDANDALQADRGKLAENVAGIYSKLDKAAQEKEAEERAEYERRSAANYVDDLLREINRSAGVTVYGTGYQYLDNVLDGGLYEGLYIVGAVSSLGKTTMILQMADQIAAQGGDVLYFTLEMSRYRLMARSISRLTALHGLEGGDMTKAKTARGILDGRRYKGYTSPTGQSVPGYRADERAEIETAFKAYNDTIAGHMYLYEGHNDTTVDDVEKAIKDHIHFTGRTPIVFIDYLQILAPHDVRATDKQNTDYNMNALARMVRENRLTVVTVSSFNRESYSSSRGGEASMTAFKESGLIEYGADVLIGLQLKGAGEKGFDLDTAKKKNPREIEAVILKNRDGRTGEKAYFNYYPMFNLFQNVSGAMDWGSEV